MHDRTHNGVPYRILNVIDEYTRERLAVRAARRLTHKDVLDVLYDLFCDRGAPVHIRSDNRDFERTQGLGQRGSKLLEGNRGGHGRLLGRVH